MSKIITIRTICLFCNKPITLQISEEQVCQKCEGRGFLGIDDDNCQNCKGQGILVPEEQKYHPKCLLAKIKQLEKEIAELQTRLIQLKQVAPTKKTINPPKFYSHNPL